MSTDPAPSADDARNAQLPPPFLGSWPRVYAALLSLLVAYIGVFLWLSARYAP